MSKIFITTQKFTFKVIRSRHLQLDYEILNQKARFESLTMTTIEG